VELASKRRLERLTLKAQKPDDARSLLGLALPLNAPTLTATANVSGQVKEGGTVNFAVTNVKASHSLKPLETAATLWRTLGDGASFDASVTLEFGATGAADAAAKLEQAQALAASTIDVQAEFGDPL
jgi:hypothetical protein